MAYSSLFIVTLLVPYPTVQHFIWPLHWCLLADICNHTYIPECGTENALDIYNRRLFIDECDMYEYNCDYEADFYPINYSSCFNLPPTPCPTKPPCPSRPPCPDHRFHNVSKLIDVHTYTTIETIPYKTIPDKTSPSTEEPQTTTTETSPWINNYDWNLNYPPRILRRYSPPFRKKKRKTTRQLYKASTVRKTIKKTARTTTRTKILKKITVIKNGRVFLKVVKAIIRENRNKKKVRDTDFLE